MEMTIVLPGLIVSALYYAISVLLIVTIAVTIFKLSCYLVRHLLVKRDMWRCWYFYLRFTICRQNNDIDHYLRKALLERENHLGSNLGSWLYALKRSTLEEALRIKDAHIKVYGDTDEHKS